MRNVEQLQTELREHLHSLERSGVVGLSATFQPAEWAAIVPRLDPEELLTLFEWLPDDDAATVLATLDPHTAADVLQIIGPVQAAAALDEMPEDDAADVLEALSDEQANALLTAIPAGEAEELRDLGQFDPDTAGGIMSPGFIAMSPSLHADQAISALRKIAAERQPITYTYILDDSVGCWASSRCTRWYSPRRTSQSPISWCRMWFGSAPIPRPRSRRSSCAPTGSSRCRSSATMIGCWV